MKKQQQPINQLVWQDWKGAPICYASFGSLRLLSLTFPWYMFSTVPGVPNSQMRHTNPENTSPFHPEQKPQSLPEHSIPDTLLMKAFVLLLALPCQPFPRQLTHHLQAVNSIFLTVLFNPVTALLPHPLWALPLDPA